MAYPYDSIFSTRQAGLPTPPSFEPLPDPIQPAKSALPSPPLSIPSFEEYKAAMANRPSAPATTQAEPGSRTWGEAAGDVLSGVGQGAYGLATGITGLADLLPGRPVSTATQYLGRLADAALGGPGTGYSLPEAAQQGNQFFQGQLSPGIRQQEESRGQAINAQQGALAKAWEAAKQTVTHPALLAQTTAEMAPLVAGMALGGGGGLASGIATGAGLGASFAGQQAGQTIMEASPDQMAVSPQYQSLRQQGLSDTDARVQMAQSAALPASIIGGLAGAVAPGLSVPIRGAAAELPALASRAVSGIGSGVENAALMAGQNVGANVGVRDQGLSRSLLEGVPEAIGEGAVVGMGAGMLHPVARPAAESKNAAPPAAESVTPDTLAEPMTSARGVEGYLNFSDRPQELSDAQISEAAQRTLPKDAPAEWQAARDKYAVEAKRRQDLSTISTHFEQNPDAVSGVAKVLDDIVMGKPMSKGAHGSRDYNLASLSDEMLNRYRLASEALVNNHVGALGKDLPKVEQAATLLTDEADRRANGDRRDPAAIQADDLTARIAKGGKTPDKMLDGLSPDALEGMADKLDARSQLEPNLAEAAATLRERAQREREKTSSAQAEPAATETNDSSPPSVETPPSTDLPIPTDSQPITDTNAQTPQTQAAPPVELPARSAGESRARAEGNGTEKKGQNSWKNFSPESGTIGIPRSEMPQIKSEHRGALVNFLNARGIEHDQSAEVDPSTLKPTQAEFSPKKVQQANEYQGGNRSILVSSDGHVVDGHHQWLSALSKGEPIKVIRLNAPIADLLPIVKEFPSSTESKSSAKAELERQSNPLGQSNAETIRNDQGQSRQGGQEEQPSLQQSAIGSGSDLRGPGQERQGSQPAIQVTPNEIVGKAPALSEPAIQSQPEINNDQRSQKGQAEAAPLLNQDQRPPASMGAGQTSSFKQTLSAPELTVYQNTAGWVEKGGYLLRDEQGNVTGRTKWAARDEWWKAYKDSGKGTLVEKEAKAQIQKAIDGRPLSAAGRRLIEFINEYHADQNKSLAHDGWLIDAVDLEHSGFESLSKQEQSTAQLQAEASRDLGEDTADSIFERISHQHIDSTPEQFNEALRGAFDEARQRQSAGSRQQASEPRSKPSAAPEGSILKDYSIAELRAEEARIAKAAAEQASIGKAASQKADADRARSDSALSESDSSAQRNSIPSASEKSANSSTVEKSRAQLVKALGTQRTSALEKSGGLVLHESDPTKTGAAGYVDGKGVIHLIPGNMDQDALSVALHEGMHLAKDNRFTEGERGKVQLAHAALKLVGLKNFIGNPGFSDLVQQVHRMASEGNKAAVDALNKAKLEARNNPNVDIAEESVAYLAQYADQKLPIVRRALAAIRSTLYRMGVKVKLTPADVRALALSALKDRAQSSINRESIRRQEAFSNRQTETDAAEQARLWQEFQAVRAQFQARQPVESAFRRWFGKGTEGVTSRDGKPITLYHGTDNPIFNQWDEARSGKASGHPTAGLGFFMTADKGAAARYGSHLLELNARINKPYYMTDADLTQIESVQDATRFRKKLLAQGYDGAVVTAPGSAPYVIALESKQVKYTTNDTPTDSPDFRYSQPRSWADTLPSEVGSMADKIGAEPKGLLERLSDMKSTLPTRLRAGLIDRFARLLELDRQRFGRDVTDTHTDLSSWVAAKMSKSPAGALESAFLHGRLKWEDGALNVQETKQGLAKALEPVASAGEMNRFWQWIIANRSERLMREGRERLFTPAEISASKRLNEGTMADGKDRSQVYQKAFNRYVEIQKSVLDVAQQAGLFDAKQRAQWEHDFYLPFYRVIENEGETRGPAVGGGKLVRQKAFELLKGGTEKLGDPLQNILQNWHHLIDASLKNRAATMALDTADKLGIAKPIHSELADKNSVWIMKDGEKVHYNVSDPLTLEALSALNAPLMDGAAIRALSAAKRALTIGTTISPAFKAANLIRDSIAAIAVSKLRSNPFKLDPLANPIKGFIASKEGSATQAALLAGGGTFRFGSLLEGDSGAAARHIVGFQPDTVLDSSRKIRGLFDTLKSGLEKWNQFGDRLETANRAALYDQLRQEGKTHLQASLAARDLMDFSQSGAWPATRFLINMVPFMNARIQGLDVLYRKGFQPLTRAATGKASASEKQQAMRFAATTFAVGLASALLYLKYKDDKDFKSREQWDRDTYWWFKIGEKAYRIPKPFEVGALGTIAERIIEQIVDKESTGKLFADRMKAMLGQTFAFDPTPQIVKPLLEVSANKDTFTGRPIETMDMERLSPELRSRYNTSALAVGASKAGLGKVGLSPVQIEHLIRGYFGWIGTQALLIGDRMARPMMGMPERPLKQSDIPVIGDMLQRIAPDGRNSRYVTEFYDQLQQVRQIAADARLFQKLNDPAAMKDLIDSHGKELAQAKTYEQVARMLSDLGRTERVIGNDRKLSSSEKQAMIDEIGNRKKQITQRAAMALR